MPPAPTVDTARLILREWRDSDIPAYSALWADPLVVRYLGDGQPIAPAEAERHIGYYRQCWRTRGLGRWAVEEAASGSLVGYCGLLPWHNESSVTALEFGYGFRRDCWGRGYATEAGRAALHWGFEEIGPKSIMATTHPGNVASQRVLAKLGFVAAGEVDGEFRPVRLFRASRLPRDSGDQGPR